MIPPNGVHLAAKRAGIPDYRGAGWRVARLRGGATKSDALAGIGRELGFPAWYGVNLDALWDCLTDLTTPTVLIWSGWERLAVSDPDAWSAIVGILGDRAEAQPPFAVWFLTR